MCTPTGRRKSLVLCENRVQVYFWPAPSRRQRTETILPFRRRSRGGEGEAKGSAADAAADDELPASARVFAGVPAAVGAARRAAEPVLPAAASGVPGLLQPGAAAAAAALLLPAAARPPP